jgi:hypothetical protein
VIKGGSSRGEREISARGGGGLLFMVHDGLPAGRRASDAKTCRVCVFGGIKEESGIREVCCHLSYIRAVSGVLCRAHMHHEVVNN